jgi:2-octaprenyl-6-methoxyphenol hydroxylase
MPDKHNESSEAIVVGGGPAGLTAAIALAEGGIKTVLVGKKPGQPDNRTTVLLAGSVTALQTLGVWALCEGSAAPLRVLRIVDDTGRLWRGPEVKFTSSEIDLDAFGYNIENRHLVAALERKAGALQQLHIIVDEVRSVVGVDDGVTVRLANGKSFWAPLAIGADGRRSICREAAEITIDERSYPQSALTVCLHHSRPHHDTSTEFHTASGPFTLVPLRGNRSSLVWVLGPQDATQLADLDDAELADEIEHASHSILGKIEVESGRGLFPLHVSTARHFADKRIALVGEAAHALPPIGAQGLNLGLRDAATISELAVSARRDGQDLGGAQMLTRYDHMRRADIGSRTFAIDLLNRTLLSDFLPAQALRGLGLYLIDNVAPLRKALMREGIAPAATQPRLMRGEML